MEHDIPGIWGRFLMIFAMRRFACSLYNFYGATVAFKGRFLLAALMLKPYQSVVKIGPQNGDFMGEGVYVKV